MRADYRRNEKTDERQLKEHTGMSVFNKFSTNFSFCFILRKDLNNNIVQENATKTCPDHISLQNPKIDQ